MKPSPWKSVPPGTCQGGHVGGDIQAGTAWDVRFWRDDQPKAVATVWVYPVKYDDRPGYRVQVQTELAICADRNEPGSTEEWADAFYRDENGVHKSLRDAERAARLLADRYAAGREHVTAWDGVSLSVLRYDKQVSR